MSKAKALMMTYEFIEREACGEAFELPEMVPASFLIDYKYYGDLFNPRPIKFSGSISNGDHLSIHAALALEEMVDKYPADLIFYMFQEIGTFDLEVFAGNFDLLVQSGNKSGEYELYDLEHDEVIYTGKMQACYDWKEIIEGMTFGG